MIPLRSLCGVLVSIVCFFSLEASHAAPAASTFPVLERPAVISNKAVHAAILSVTRAGDRLVAVGERGIVLLSDDSGRNWRQVNVPVGVTLTAVQFVSPKAGWAVGHFGIVLHTTDGGETWREQLNGIEAAELALSAAQKLVAEGRSGSEQVLRDAQYLVSDGPDKPFLDLHFVNENVGYIIGAYNLIFRTDDGGETWVSWQSHVDNPTGMHLYSMRPVGDALYIAGEQGLLLKADRTGELFSAVQGPYEGSYFGLVADRSAEVVVFGLRGNTFLSGDQGKSWSRVNLGTQISISNGIRLSGGEVVLISQTGELFISKDPDKGFASHPMPQPLPATCIAQTSDGALVVSSLRGLTRIELNDNK